VRELSIPAKAHNAFREGIERLEQDDVPGGAAQFRRAIAAFPSYYEAHYQLGLAELRLGLQANAEQSFRKSVELSEGRYFSSQMALGALLCEQGRFAEAETAIRQALEQRNNSWLGQFYLARVLLGLGQLEEAAESAHEVILRNASLPEVYLVLADIHFRQNKQEALLNDLDEYLRLAPDTANSLEAKAIREKVWHALSIRNSLHP
jgi:type IV pilus assembly protein PilF